MHLKIQTNSPDDYKKTHTLFKIWGCRISYPSPFVGKGHSEHVLLFITAVIKKMSTLKLLKSHLFYKKSALL